MQNNQKIPEGWSVKRLGDICLFSSGGTPSKSKKEYWNNGTIKWLSAKYIDNNKVCGYDLITDAGKDACKIAHKGDIILVTRVSVGKLLFCNEDFAVNQDLTIIHTTKMMPLYLFNVLMKKNQEIIDRSQGLAIKGITKEALSDILFLLPPLQEQEKIAEILGTWDEAIEKLSNLIEQKKLLKKGLMQKLLTGKTRLPGFTQPWKEVKLKEMGHITSAGVDKNIVPGEQNVILLNYMDVYRKDFIYKDDIKQIVTAPDSKIKNCNVLMGDVFFTPSSETRDDIGHSAVIMENIPGAVYSYHVVRFRPILNHLSRDFCAYAFKTSKFYKQAYSLCEGSGQRYVLSQDYFRNMSVFIPTDLKEQQAIADVLSTADDEINLLNQKLEALKEQKKGLMQQLLTGQIRVKVN